MSAEENKRVLRRYFEEFHSQRMLAIGDQIMTPAMCEGASALAAMMTRAFPDYQISVLDQVAEGDKVATVWKAHGTHQGDWMSPMGPVSASGQAITFTGTTTVLLRDGKVAELIGSNWDHLGILQQMGAVPRTAPRAGGEAPGS